MTVSKEAKDYIAQEQQVLREVRTKLEEQLRIAQGKLASEQIRARELTSEMVAAYREEEKQMLASDEAVSHALSHQKLSEIKALQELLENPYFARLVIEEEVNGKPLRREYRLSTHANPDCRIIDWRHAPISKLYYEYQEGDEFCEEIQGVERFGTVIERSSVFIDKGQLVQIKSGFGTFALEAGEWHMRAHASSSFGRSSYGNLPSIMALLSETQYAAITNEVTSSVLIEGVAGSGKTTVALYRLSWLLEQKDLELEQSDCLVVLKSPVLRTYIEKSLISLGIHGVEIFTVDEWTQKVLAHYQALDRSPLEGIQISDERLPFKLKSLVHSSKFVNQLEQQELERRDHVGNILESEFSWETVPKGLSNVFDQEQFEVRSADALLASLLKHCTKALDRVPPTHRLFDGIQDLKQKLTSLFTQLPHCLERIQQCLNQLDTSTANCYSTVGDYYKVPEELTTSILKVLQIQGRKLLRPTGGSGQYEHTLIDEAQDLSPLEFSLMTAATKDYHRLTVVGDRAQKVSMEQLESAFDLLESPWGERKKLNNVLKLEISYRSTQQIIDIADHVKGSASKGTGRAGDRTRLYQCFSEEAGLSAACDWINERLKISPTSPMIVLCVDAHARRQLATLLKPSFGNALHQLSDSNTEFDTGIIVSDVVTAKGLEFQSVLLWDVSNSAYPKSQYARNLLHVGITRAEDAVGMICWGQLNSFLTSVNSELLDIYEIEPEPEEEPLPSA